jgi:hypothetical protein
MLYLVWSEGFSGPAYITKAPANDALSYTNWQRPIRISIPVDKVLLQIDSKNIFHLLYIQFLGENQGVYYMRSMDEGITWSSEHRLDPDILPDYGPRSLHFALDQDGGLHAAWYYVPRNDVGGDWVRYSHSLDGGETWSEPFTVDRNEEGMDDLQSAGPVMTVSGRTVVIVWGSGTPFIVRYYRYSRDAGQTWSGPIRLMGDLNGQAFDGMAVDGAGRVHYFAQIRFPQGVYHSYLDRDQWSAPSMVYLIKLTDDEPLTQIHAHYTRGIFRAGNQLILTFTDPPPDTKRRLFVMVRTLSDINPISVIPTPIPTATPVPQPSPSPAPTDSVDKSVLTTETMPPVTEIPSPMNLLLLGSVPAMVLIAGIFAYKVFLQKRRIS